MKRILQLTKYMYPYIGGIEQTTRDIALSLKHMEGIEQKIICFDHQSKKTTVDVIDGVEIVRCGVIAKISSQPISPDFPHVLKQIMERFSPDIVIFHYPNPFEAKFLLEQKNHFKLILWWHLDIVKQKNLGKLFHGQNLQLLKKADKIVATSPNYIEGSKYLHNVKEKICVIPSCINTERLMINERRIAVSEKIKHENKDKIICFGIGRHVEYKGYQYLIDAVKLLDNSFHIYIGGEGSLTGLLKAMSNKLNNVNFLGKINDDLLIGYLLACDIFCFPSITKNEAFGLALAEGMYFGKPAVTFTIPGSGVNYVNLDGVTGIECPNCDSKAYAEALKKLADAPELRKKFGEAARQRVLENFTEEIFRTNLLRLIDTIL